MTTKHYLYLGLGILVAMFALGRCSRGRSAMPTLLSPNGPKVSATPVLPSNDRERITFNEKTHILTVQTQTKTITEYAKNPIIELRKDGSVGVSRHLMGFEIDPWLGGGYADTGRLFIGANVFHFSRFDISGSLSWTPDNRYVAVQPFLALGYNVYSNSDIAFVANPLSLTSIKGLEFGIAIFVRL